ncbi:MAG: hypothetical protein AABY10_04225 [Nanoarchaeota archaeon]
MKKVFKIILTLVVSILLYAGFYYLLISSSTEKNSWSLTSTFYTSVIYSFLGIFIGFLLIWYIQRKNLELPQMGYLQLTGGLIWMGLFGLLSICGFILGEIIAEKPVKKIKPVKKNLMFDLEGLGAKYWILSVLIVLSVLIIPMIIMIITQPSSFSQYPLIILAISVLTLSGSFFKETKNRKEGSSYTQFQKSILVIIAGLFLIEIIFGIFSFVNFSSLQVSTSANSIGEEYANAMTYYSNRVDQSLGQVQLKITQKDYVAARSAVGEYISVRKNMSAKLFELCDKAENKSISLSGTPELDEMNLTCSHRELQDQCNDEESINMLAGIDYFKIISKTKSDCYKFVSVMENNTGKCIELQKLLGNPQDKSNWSDLKEQCGLLPDKLQGILG